MLGAMLAAGCYFDDGHLLIVAVAGLAIILAAGGRRSSRTCTRCHQTNRDEAVYCAQCGRRLSEK